MNRQQIMSRLTKVLGKNAHYQTRPDAPDADEREALYAAHKVAREARDAAQKRMAARTEALQAADAEYQSALADYKAAGDAKRKSQSFHAYRISAGRVSSVGGLGMFHVEAQGDTWPEVFAKLEAKH